MPPGPVAVLLTSPWLRVVLRLDVLPWGPVVLLLALPLLCDELWLALLPPLPVTVEREYVVVEL